MKCVGKLASWSMSAFLAGLLGCSGERPPVAKPAVTFAPGQTEVVIAEKASGAVRFAAGEATNFLSRVLGAAVPIVHKPTAGKQALVLGVNDWSAAAGVTTNGLARDAFRLKTGAAALYVAGVDSPGGGWMKGPGGETMPVGFSSAGEHATLFGVYEFLQRYTGVRLYFPGELGEVVPKAAAVNVPPLDETVTPAFRVRNVYMSGDGVACGETDAGRSREMLKALNWTRLRLQTEYVPCCHGQCRNMFLNRFGKTHPEYFALLKGKDGKLHRDSEECMRLAHPTRQYYYLCQSSAAWDEMYADAASYLRGEDASVRKVPAKWTSNEPYGWGGNVNARKYVDVMCEDGFQPCQCAGCQKAYDMTQKQYATELIWGQTARLAQRLKDAGIRGYVTQMAYPPYHAIPKVELPDNVLVMVAHLGPWGDASPDLQKADFDEVVAWTKKAHGKVWLWNYITKYGGFAIRNVPCVTPKAVGKYYAKFAPYIFGVFAESGCEKQLYQYLNYYVFSRVCWDPYADVDAILDEHYRGMFGPAAAEMQQFFESLEAKWIHGVGGTRVMTESGPAVFAPSTAQLFGQIYSTQVCAEYDRLFAAARRKLTAQADPESLIARRLDLFEREYLAPLKVLAESVDVKQEQARRRGRVVKSILTNGSFDTLTGWNSSSDGKMSADTNIFVSPPASVRVDCKQHFSVMQNLKGKLIPGHRYRVSYFMRTGDLDVSTRYPGIYAEFFCGSLCQYFPRMRATYGKSDWIHRSETFVYGPIPEGQEKTNWSSTFRFFVSGFKGTVWFDDVIVEDLGEEKRK